MPHTYVLIPGAGGTALYWSRVAPMLADAGHRVAALDLPNWPGATLADQADAIVAAGVGADQVVLVAQSMGGFSAPLACDRLPIHHVFLVNAMIPMPGETPGQWWDNTGQSQAMRSQDIAEGRDPDAGFDLSTYFLHDLPPDAQPRDDRFFPYDFQRRVAEERLGLIAEQVPGGHLCALSQPEALGKRLLR